MIWRECEYCKQRFATYPSVVKLGRGQFCSKKCARSFHYGKKYAPSHEPDSKKVALECAVCGEPFQVARSELDKLNRECCSVKCKAKKQTKKERRVIVHHSVEGYSRTACGRKLTGTIRFTETEHKVTCKACVKSLGVRERRRIERMWDG